MWSSSSQRLRGIRNLVEESIEVTFSLAINLAFRRWSDFTGRSTRGEFWFFTLFQIICVLPLFILDAILLSSLPFYPLTTIFWIFMLAPTLSISVRRLHDQNKKWWWLLIWLIPVIGWVAMIKIYASPTTAYWFGPFNLKSIVKIKSDRYFQHWCGIILQLQIEKNYQLYCDRPAPQSHSRSIDYL